MTYIVNESCIKCKLMDCVEVCPVDCFYEGENMLVIHPDECIDCGVCEPECPVDAIDGDKKKIHIIDQERCTNCGTCFEVCPARFGAVKKISGEPLPSPVAEEDRMIIKEKEQKQ